MATEKLWPHSADFGCITVPIRPAKMEIPVDMTTARGRYRHYVERLTQSVLTTVGATDAPVRRAVEARAAALGGRAAAPPTEGVPAAVERYVDKVARHAYKVTDADVEALTQARYSEDAIFEITLSAALGAALGRLECGLRALGGY